VIKSINQKSKSMIKRLHAFKKSNDPFYYGSLRKTCKTRLFEKK